MRKKLILCMTSDILYDRRMLRISKSLLIDYDVMVLSRRLHREDLEMEEFGFQRIKCFFNSGFLFYAEYNLRLLLLLMIKPFDILVAVDYDTLLPCVFAKRLRGGKLVFDAHEYFEESVEIVTRKRIQKFWSWVGRLGIKSVDLAYTVSETIASIYTKMHKITFHTIRNLPSKGKSHDFVQKKDSKIVLYQGVLNKGRKLEQFIEAAGILGNDYKFWIVGEGDESEKLRAKNVDNVKFFSWVRPQDLSEITYQTSLGFNLLDDLSKSYYLSLANKFFDYMHAGVPSLNNDFPEYLNLNERYNCCYTVNLKGSEDLAKFVSECLSNKELLEEKRKNSLIASRDLCWEREEQKLKKLYKQL